MQNFIKNCKLKLKYFRYKNFFLEVGVDLKNCDKYFGVNIILLLDIDKSVVYRCSLNGLGYIAILKNYDFLQDLKVDNIPAPLGLWQKNGAVISAESLMQGNKLQVSDIDIEMTRKILKQLRPLYVKNIIKVNFDFENWAKKYNHFLSYYNSLWIEKLAQIKEKIIKNFRFLEDGKNREVINSDIHGDLTFRNIITNEEKLFFLDFDRSEINFPELDIFLFCIDTLTYKKGTLTYNSFFNNIIDFINEKIDFHEIGIFYDLNKEFEANRQFDKHIKYLFLYRMLILILQVFDIQDRQPAKLLDKILYEL